MPARDRQFGMSPFNTKGLVYVGAKDYYQAHVPGGLPAVCQAIEDPDLRAFFQQEFVSHRKYDILPLVPISAAAAAAVGVSSSELVRANARWLAERDIHGIYSIFLKLSSPRLVAPMLPKASLQYFSFGTAKGEMEDSHCLLAYQSGLPVLLAPWMMWAVSGFAPVALEMAGAKQVTVRQHGGLTDERTFHGHPICKLTWRIQWAA